MNSAVLVIGNEVLAGKVTDINSNFFIKKLWEVGTPVQKVEIIPDEFDQIVERVQHLSAHYDYLFVTGGIGATHDDLTRQAVSQAVGVACVPNAQAIQLMQDHYQHDLDETQKEMACLPEGSDLILNPISYAPGFKIKNIFVFPGFPEMIQDMFPSVLPFLKGRKLYYEEIGTQLKESQYAKTLKEVSDSFGKEVQIGSYPKLPPSPYKTIISITSRSQELLQEAKQSVIQALGLAS